MIAFRKLKCSSRPPTQAAKDRQSHPARPAFPGPAWAFAWFILLLAWLPAHSALAQAAEVSGRVLLDVNANGILDPEDTNGLSGVTVVLQNADGIPLLSLLTAPDGSFHFTNLVGGDYIVEEVDPPAHFSTADSDGINDNRIAVMLGDAQVINDLRFLDAPNARIAGRVLEDRNGNGLFDPEDTNGIPGVTLVLQTTNAVPLATAVTGPNGAFLFTNVDPGSYVVVELDPPSHYSTGDASGANDNLISVTITAGQLVTGVDFLDALPALVTGRVRLDANGNGTIDPAETSGITGATLILETLGNVPIATTTTGPTGSYSFAGLARGSYRILEIDPPGYYSTADAQGPNDNQITVSATNGATSANNDFLDAPTGRLPGRVLVDVNGNGIIDAPDTNGLAGVLLLLQDTNGTLVASTATSLAGEFLFPSIPAGNYTLIELDPSSYYSTGDSGGSNDNRIAVSISPGQTAPAQFFLDAQTGTITGDVRFDVDGDGFADPEDTNGVPNAVIRVLAGTNLVTSVTNRADGTFVITNLAARDYLIQQVVPSGYLPTTPTTLPVTLLSGGSATARYLDKLDCPAPIITCPADVTVTNATSLCAATNVALGSPTVTSPCRILALTNNAPASFPVGTNTVMWTVVDANTNVACCLQRVIVRDVQAPSITCPPDVTVVANAGLCAATNVALGSPVTTDNCAVASVTNNAPASFPVGTNTVTWTVTDRSGNTNTCTQRVIVRDTQPPSITCPADVTVVASAGLCAATNVALGSPVTADNCAVASVTNNAPASLPVGTNTVTWTVTDIHGNSSTCTQRVIVRDTQPPSITCPADVTVPANPGVCLATGVTLGLPTTTDNCAVASVTNNASASFPVGTNTVTWTVTDIHGNSSTCTQRVIVQDTQPPSITCPADVTVPADAGLCAASGVALGTPTTADNCGVASITNNAPASYPVGTNTVTWTVTDRSGNTSSCTQRIIVRDTQPPSITCPADVTVPADAGLCAAVGVSLGLPTTADNCAVNTVTNNAPGSYPVGTNTVTWTVTDIHGNSSTCTQRVVVQDTQAPSITCPADVTVPADAGLCAAVGVSLGLPTTADNCAVATVTNNAPASFPVGTNTVTWTVTDRSGNTTSCEQRVIVQDTQPPSITCPPDVTVLADSGTCAAGNVTLGTPVATDNCAVAAVTNNAPASYPVGTNSVLWTATDRSGNTSSCTQLVIVRDAQPPSITCPPDVTVVADAGLCSATNVALGTPITADNCAVGSVTNNAAASTSGVLLPYLATGYRYLIVGPEQQPGFQQVGYDDSAFLVGDAGFGSGLCDLNSPEFNKTFWPVGSDLLVRRWLQLSPRVDRLIIKVAIDNDIEVFVNGTNVSGGRVVHEGCPTRDNFTFAVTRGGLSAGANLIAVRAIDRGGSSYFDMEVSSEEAAPSPASFSVGTNLVTWVVTDAHGNTNACTQRVIVLDTQPPTITCPATVTLPNSPGLCGITNAALGTPLTADNCAVASVTNNAPAFLPVGTNTVTWTVTDVNGNTASCQQQVIVRDVEGPVVICPADVAVPVVLGGCMSTNASYGIPSVSDNCGIASIISDTPPSLPVGDHVITWTVTDIHGNVSTCRQNVLVQDTQLPRITCASNLTLIAPAGFCAATNASLRVPTVSDNCGIGAISVDAPIPLPVGTNVVTWRVVDINGNEATCLQLVIVRDAQPPTLVCPPDVTVNAPAGLCAVTSVALGTPTVVDNCAVATVTSNTPASYPVGTNTVTWTATDIYGNTATCQQRVIVRDTQPPTITCPATVTVNADPGSCAATGVTLGTPTTADNCAVASVTNNAPASYPVGTNSVTWTVTDVNGNTNACTQTVIVRDTQVPTITCPATVTVNANAGSCFATGVALGTPVTADNCTVATVTSNAPASYPVGTNTVTWTVTDRSGNTASCTQSVIVRDTQVPSITCPATVTVNANAGTCAATGVALGTPVTADNCTVVTVTSNAPASYPVGTNTVTWTVTDRSGNTASCTQTVIVRDNQPPVLTCPATVTVNAAAGTCAATGVTLGTPTVTDNCGVASISSNAPASYPVGTNIVTWTAIDVNGNTNTCTQSVIVRDTQVPTITCPATVTVNANAGSCFATGVALGTPVTADNCTVATVTSNAPASFPVGTNTVTWIVTDRSGNTASCTQTVIVRDTQVPTITCPATVTVNANAGSCFATGVALGTPVTADNCTVVTVTSNAPASYPVGTNTVTWTVTDRSGNTASCTQTVIVRDNQPPVLTCPATVTVNAAAGTCAATGVTLGTPTVTDNCGVASISSNAPASYPVGTNIVTWTAIDVNGNTNNCTQSVIVRDTQLPTITCPATVTVNANAGSCFATGVALGTPVTADNCTVATVTSNAPASFPVGTNTVTWIVTDRSGNTASCTQTVIVRDTQVPAITCPPTVTVNANPGACAATGVALGTPVTADNCTVASVTSNAPASYPVGTNTVTWTVTDIHGNTASCTQTVIVRDTQPPTITCPATVTVNANAGTCAATGVTLGTPTTADNCGVASVTSNAPASYPVGTNTVTWTVTDIHGNTASCTQTVIVRDTQPPTISCPAPVTVNADAGACAATGVTLGTPTTTDNCGVASVNHNAPASLPVGTNTVTWTVTDVNGNTASCTQTVIVRDTQVPTITCPPTVTVNADAGACAATSVPLGTPITADNCGVASVTSNAPASYPVGTNTVTWTVTDRSGNTASCTQTVIVRDTQPPTISCPATVTVNADAGSCAATGVALGTPVTADNCAIASVTSDASASFPVGTHTVTWTVTDIHGNTASCSQTVIVRDTQPPTITCPADVMLGAAANLCAATSVTLGTPTATDNCGIASVSSDAPATFPIGTNLVTWTATDLHGNTSTCQQQVVVRDVTPPSVICPANLTLECATELPAPNPALVQAVDRCSEPVSTIWVGDTLLSSNCPTRYTVARTYRSTDAVGNAATCVQQISLFDDTPPSMVCPPTITILPGQSLDPMVNTNLGVATATDNCPGLPVITYSDSEGQPACPKTILRTWSARDACGNVQSCVQIIAITYCPVLITDGGGRTLPDNTFDLLYTSAPGQNTCFELTASNPGQFKYHSMIEGTPGQAATIRVTFPYPWVTQGAQAIHAYDGFAVTPLGNGLLHVQHGSQIATFSTQIGLTNYPVRALGSTTTILVKVIIPPTGMALVSIHMDYGLKKSAPYSRSDSMPPDALECGTSRVVIPALSNYGFATQGATTGQAFVRGLNNFKPNYAAAFAGRVLATADGQGLPGVSLFLTMCPDSTTQPRILSEASTDANGYYLFPCWLLQGKTSVNYQVICMPPLNIGPCQTNTMTLQNGMPVEALFQY